MRKLSIALSALYLGLSTLAANAQCGPNGLYPCNFRERFEPSYPQYGPPPPRPGGPNDPNLMREYDRYRYMPMYPEPPRPYPRPDPRRRW